jgi:hypothetical protein
MNRPMRIDRVAVVICASFAVGGGGGGGVEERVLGRSLPDGGKVEKAACLEADQPAGAATCVVRPSGTGGGGDLTCAVEVVADSVKEFRCR